MATFATIGLSPVHGQTLVPPVQILGAAEKVKPGSDPDPETRQRLIELDIAYENGKYISVSASGERVDLPFYNLQSPADCKECMINTDIFKRLTKDDVKMLAKKEKDIAQNLVKGANAPQTTIHTQSVNSAPFVVTAPYMQIPDVWDNRNACGPQAIKVAIGARKPTSQIPWLDTIGQAVIGSNWRNTGVVGGTQVYNMRDYLNQQLAFSWYGFTNSDSQTTFGNHMRSNYDHNTAMITGLYANGMPYWNTGSNIVPHIVAVYGFTTDSTSVWAGTVTNFYYVDANTPVAGHYNGNTSTYAPYYNVLTASQMWTVVTQYSWANNWQIW